MGQWNIRADDGRMLSVATILTADQGVLVTVDIPKRIEGQPLRFTGERAQDVRHALGLAIGETHQGENWSPR